MQVLRYAIHCSLHCSIYTSLSSLFSVLPSLPSTSHRKDLGQHGFPTSQCWLPWPLSFSHFSTATTVWSWIPPNLPSPSAIGTWFAHDLSSPSNVGSWLADHIPAPTAVWSNHTDHLTTPNPFKTQPFQRDSTPPTTRSQSLCPWRWWSETHLRGTVFLAHRLHQTSRLQHHRSESQS